MKNLLFAFSSFLVLFTSCNSNNDDTPTYEAELSELMSMQAAIESLINTSICDDTYECKYIAFGNKPCGGPMSYLIYSTSIDVEKLESMVENFNMQHTLFNQKWSIVSDCALVTPPTSVNCENNTCVAVY